MMGSFMIRRSFGAGAPQTLADHETRPGPARPGGLVSGFGSQSRVAAHMPPGGQGLWLGMATGKQPR